MANNTKAHYNPGPDGDNRVDTISVEYMVNTSGDRWFIPYNSDASMADQLAQCKRMVGNTNDGSDYGAQVVPS